MAVRSVEELMQVADPAWPLILAAIEDSDSATVLPASPPQAEATLFALQVSVQSALGALALNAGGVLIDKGWIRILGAGAEGLPGLAAANGLSHPSTSSEPPPFLLVAFDVLGGRFAIDGGGLGIKPGEVCYLGPDTLRWEGLDIGHGAFVNAFVGGAGSEFYEALRWPSWSSDVEALHLDQGIATWPPPFTAEGSDLSSVSRRVVPFKELIAFYDDAAAQL